ncbi:MAG: hypothetical protein JNM17_19335 [Archangium sp.]|nr:hypothetical protein [Archangium sp.]
MTLKQQLMLTPQLQLAIQLLSKPLLAQQTSGMRALAADETDPLDASELEAAREEAREPWLWQRLPMLPCVEGQPDR